MTEWIQLIPLIPSSQRLPHSDVLRQTQEYLDFGHDFAIGECEWENLCGHIFYHLATPLWNLKMAKGL